MQQSGRPCPVEPTASGLIPLCISVIRAHRFSRSRIREPSPAEGWCSGWLVSHACGKGFQSVTQPCPQMAPPLGDVMMPPRPFLVTLPRPS